ncbi:HPP family protein [Synechococcus sp. CBW1108]|nr:HPP family protein [Synechococcus sp. CBW1108]
MRSGPTLATALYLALITALANASAIPLLLFPKLGALASVLFSDPAGSLARSPRLLVLTPVLTAILGVGISRTIPYGPVSVVLILLLSLLVIRALRSPIVPAISAGMLPLALGITSWQYPATILVGTGGLALLAVLPSRLAPGTIPQPRLALGHGPIPSPWLPLAIFVAGGLLLVQLLGSRVVLYPPLFVICWEMLAQPHHCPWQERPFAVLLVTGVAAVAGSILVEILGVSPQAAFLAVLVTGLALQLAQLTCPPPMDSPCFPLSSPPHR